MKNSAGDWPEISETTLDSALFESSPDCVKLLNCDGQIVTMNQNGLCAMEIDDVALIAGATWKTLWPEKSHADIEAAVAAGRRGEIGHFSAFCPTAKGTPRWWDVIVTPVRLEDGRIEKLLAVSRDITSTHQAALQLRASEARFRSLVTATSAIVWNCPASGRFETEQFAWAAFTGQTLDEYQGWGWLDAVHPDDHAHTTAAWKHALDAQSLYQTEHRLRRADGEYHHMHVRGVPISDETGVIYEWVGVHTDISTSVAANAERERLLREVQAATNRMADIFQKAPAFMCVLGGPDHVFEIVNERFLQLVGNRDFVGQSVRQSLPEVEGQGFLELLDQVYKTGEPFVGIDMPVRLQRSFGAPLEQRIVDFVYMPLRNADGAVTGILVHGIDQTHRKLAELAQKENQDRLLLATEAAELGLWSWSPVEGKVVWENQRSYEIFGLPLSDTSITAKSFIEHFVYPDDVSAFNQSVALTFETGARFFFQGRIRRTDGSVRWVEFIGRAQPVQDAAPPLIIGTISDITSRKLAEIELYESRERFQKIVSQAATGVVQVNIEGRVTLVNQRYCEMLGYSEDELLGMSVVDITAPDFVQPTLDALKSVIAGGPGFVIEKQYRRKNGSFIWATSSVSALRGPAGEYQGAVAIVVDITDRKRADEKLRRLASDLSEADRRKTEFLATLAHELRNPLAPIRSGLGVMRLAGDNPSALAKVRDMMDRQVSYMVRLIDDLLDVARISGGKMDLKKERVDLKHVLSGAVETSLPLIEAAQHQLEVDIPDDPLPIIADLTRIAQVVANLLNNAAKYTPAGGHIRLSARREGSGAVITVTDSGVGIPEESLATVFDMFSQVGRNLDRSQGGLGIGLSLVRRLVEMHGGTVVAMSAGAGKGSTFTVRLPLARAVEEENDAAILGANQKIANAPKKFRILVVDDNSDAADTLSAILKLNGHVTRVANDGVQGMAAAKDFRPEVAFLDIGMPGMNGYEVAQALRRTPDLNTIALVALTGWGAEDDRVRSKSAGFDYHLTKPADIGTVDSLLSKLANLM
jgi:PAS domain S-box-containing protein